jgi:hypothetical protein
MSRPTRVREWHLFLGTRESENAEAELMRLVRRLDDAHDAVSYILRLISGCPAGEAEEALRIARTSIDEGIEYLQKVVSDVRREAPDVA